MIWERSWVFPFTGSMEALKKETLIERQTLLRKALNQLDIDAALINLDAMRGASRWFFNETAVGANDEGFALLLPAAGGGFDMKRAQQHVSPTVQQIGDVLHIGGGEAHTFDFASVLNGCKKVGLAFAEKMNANFYEKLVAALPDVQFEDITALYMECRAQNNSDELEHIERSALQHDRIMQAAQTEIRLGRTETEIINDLKMNAYRNGGSGFSTLYFAGAAMVSAQPTEKVTFNGIPYPGRYIQLHDRIALRMNCVGISGFYGDIARLFVFGNPDEETKTHWDHVLEIQHEIAKAAVIGTTVSELKNVYHHAIARLGEQRCREDFMNGIGCGPKEGPSSAFDQIPLQENMVVSIHPTIFDENNFPYCAADMYRITAQGAVRITKTSQEICCL